MWLLCATAITDNIVDIWAMKGLKVDSRDAV